MNVSAFLAEAAGYEEVLLDAVMASSEGSQAVVGSNYYLNTNPACLYQCRITVKTALTYLCSYFALGF